MQGRQESLFKQFLIKAIPLGFILGIVYFASSMPYEQQDVRPMLREVKLVWVEKWFSNVSFVYSEREISIDYLGIHNFVEFFIRKSAHVLVFFLIGFFLYRLLTIFSMNIMTRILLSLLFIFIFASFDEYRHMLNPNRTGLIQDVILDTTGGFLGIIISLLVQKVVRVNRSR